MPSSRRPPDILRKSHAHSTGKDRAQARRELERELDASIGEAGARFAVVIDRDSEFWRDQASRTAAATAVEWLGAEKIPYAFVEDTASRRQEFFAAMLAQFGDLPERAWIISDTMHAGLAAAQAAGFRLLLVCSGGFEGPDPESGIEPDAVIDSIADLPQALAD